MRQELSSEIVEGREERYQFTWPDKKKAVLLANSPINATLRPCREESVDFDNTQNLYIEGDNLDVLKCLKVHLSAVPKMYFTATTYTLAEAGNGCSYPLMTSGKAVTREGCLVFPLSIYVNHAFVDGSHLSSFFQKIEEHQKRISRE